jgi:hypothetical protein
VTGMHDPDWAPDLDLGDGHTLSWVTWRPDRALNPQYADLPDVDRWGATVNHAGVQADGQQPCPGGFITFEQAPEFARLLGDRPTWRIEQPDPLTVSPSLACRLCGDHGWIREGRWRRA